MTSLPVDPALIEWYARSYDESARLERSGHGRLELVRTRELIGAHLREQPMRVLDVGGGPGSTPGGWPGSATGCTSSTRCPGTWRPRRRCPA